jgi:hypothetical protein
MKLHKNAEDIANYLYCLGVLEEKAASLYMSLAEKMEWPLVKSMVLQIAYDSQKHSAVLQGVVQSISASRKKLGSCAKNLKQELDLISSVSKEISRKDKIAEVDFASIEGELTALESVFGEEYSVMVDLETLRRMSGKILEVYKLDLSSLGTTFLNIIRDEDTHRSLLADIRKLFLTRQEKKADNAPMVKYQNPDVWTRF